MERASLHRTLSAIHWPLREWPATFIGAFLALNLVLAAWVGDFDFIKLHLTLLDRIQKHQIDDFVVAFVLIFVGLAFDGWVSEQRKLRQAEIEEQRLKVLRATMRTVQDVMNNFLNQMQLFRLEADSVLPEESLEAFDELIEQASGKLKALGNLDEAREIQMATGTGIECPAWTRSIHEC
jgi:hypothetical protein